MGDFKPFFVVLMIHIFLFAGNLSQNADSFSAYFSLENQDGLNSSQINDDINNFDNTNINANQTNIADGQGASGVSSGTLFTTLFLGLRVLTDIVINQVLRPDIIFSELGFKGIFKFIAVVTMYVINLFAVLKIIINR